jgi:hypothetical protein
MNRRNRRTSIEEMDVYCGISEYTETASEINLPIFVMEDVLLAQDHAVGKIYDGTRPDRGYVYNIRVSNAEVESVGKKMILHSGDIQIREIITIENHDGKTARTDRKTL